MRIHLDNVNLGSATGPNTFATRLARRLLESGHDLPSKGQDADVSLVFIEPSGVPLAKTVVQRLDGIWFKPDEFKTKNVCIVELYRKADAIVFQSQFDRDFIEHHWGLNDERQRQAPIIGNGIELHPVKELTIPKLIEMRGTYEQVYVCSSNWHPQKRLRDNFRLFERFRKQQPNSCLIILGANPDFRATGPNVFYAGSVPPEVYMEIYSAANWMIHLAWADHCPNVVVEALSQGTPVICSEYGGTKELIGFGSYGHVLKEKYSHNYELYDYDNPPELDVTQCTFLPTRDQLMYEGIPNIDIKFCADQYVKLFESLVRR